MPTMTVKEELEAKGFSFVEDDHTLVMEYKGHKVATFGNHGNPELIRTTADWFLRSLDVRMGQ